ncbi:TRAP transporter small permease [Aestuariivita sp.]|uniref:TRAP transporter small permease n=1 Tax=Aestuariivita sp. TaxID=1872407 RepID=UPI002170A8DC|nr:TRAP transporter small permease [Aestuariivita sp.]MCE8005569.1 TRAP transporter small permease [Aestuariivita sp.]
MLRFLDIIENIALWTGCLALLIMGALVTGSVLGRSLFNAPIPDDLLMIGLLMVCVIVLPLSYVERSNGHIVVTVIADRLPVRVQRVLRIFGQLIFAAFMGTMGFVIARKVPSEFEQNLYYDGHLEVPTWPMKAVFAFGVAVFLLRIVTNIIRDLRETDQDQAI